MLSKTLLTAAVLGHGLAQDISLGFNTSPEVETRTIDEIYQAALAEGGVVTCWHGGDEKTQQNSLVTAFEAKFPGMTLNMTVDLSKYHDGNLDAQLAANKVYVDSIILQTLHDYPRWAQQGALLNYAPLGWDKLYPAFKEPTAAYYGVRIINWLFQWNTNKLPGATIAEFSDLLKPEFKDKLVLTYPNDDDAVLYAFELILQGLGTEWLDGLLAQNPRWVRGTATPRTIITTANATEAVTFTSSGSLTSGNGLNVSFPTKQNFVSWAQRGAILKDAPHPEGAKLLHAYMLSDDFQVGKWSVRQDVGAPNGTSLPDIMHMPGTNPTAFATFMSDRTRAERLRFFLESKIGTAQGLSPLIDDL